MDKVWEEFVADVLSGKSTFSQQFSEVVNNYWSGNDTNLDNFKVSEYTHSTDAGGNDGTEYSLNNSVQLSNSEWKEFYRSLSELNRGIWFPKNSDGSYIFETKDKLIFTDGDYISPQINCIVTFENLNSEEIEYGKEIIWNASERGKSRKECCQTARDLLGKGTITETNPYSYRANWKGTNGSGKRSNSFNTDKRVGTRENYVGVPSSVLDFEYLTVAYRGDLKTAQQMVDKISNTKIKELKKTVQGEPFSREVSKILDMLEATNSEMEFFFRMKEKYPEELKYLTEEDILEQ